MSALTLDGLTLLASGAACRPFGPLAGLTLGSGANTLPLAWPRDLDGRVTGYPLGSGTRTLEILTRMLPTL